MPAEEVQSSDPRPSKLRFQLYVDPLFGSERFIEFPAEWVAEVEERTYRVTPWRKYPVTFVKFKNGRHYLLMGHHAEEIRAAQAMVEADEGVPKS
jgi:hypothetical protein